VFLTISAAIGLLALLGSAIFLRRKRRDQQKQEMRISVAELNNRLLRHDPLRIVDLRHPLDVLAAPQVIPGAIPIKPDEIDSRIAEFPRDEATVLYCTCPNEETSLAVYHRLREHGLRKVKILTGGLPAWKREKLPLQELYPELEQQLRKQASAHQA
jgi:rhodanese-related sulfurtransferase